MPHDSICRLANNGDSTITTLQNLYSILTLLLISNRGTAAPGGAHEVLSRKLFAQRSISRLNLLRHFLYSTSAGTKSLGNRVAKAMLSMQPAISLRQKIVQRYAEVFASWIRLHQNGHEDRLVSLLYSQRYQSKSDHPNSSFYIRDYPMYSNGRL